MYLRGVFMKKLFWLLCFVILVSSVMGQTWAPSPPGDEEEPPPFITAEICDGIDNDQDGMIDEDNLGNPLTKSCGSGVCQGIRTCISGVWSDCSSIGLNCGTKDCDYLDTNCRDYQDKTQYCSANGTCSDPSCNSYTNNPSSTTCGTVDCDYLDTECRNYNDKTEFCDGLGSCQTASCDSYTNEPSTTQCGTDYYQYSCYWGNGFGDDIGKMLIDYHCDSGSCSAFPSGWMVDELCTPNQYCSGSGISTDRNDYLCSSSVCNSDSDCGTDGFIGETYCVENQVWNTYRTYYCENAGTLSAQCIYSDTKQEKTQCDSLCSNGACQSPFEIEDITVKVDGKSSKNLKDGDKISKKAKPESKVRVDVKVKNNYEEDTSLEDVESDVTIEDIDDGDDLEEEDDVDEIRPQRSKTLSVSFDIPKEVEEDTYDMIIELTGDDELGNDYDFEIDLELQVEKENHDIEIEDASLTPSTVICEKSTQLHVSILNMGSSDEDEARLTIQSSLGLNIEENFSLSEAPDEDDRFEKTYPIDTADLPEGDYPIEIKTYSRVKDLMDTKTIYLTKLDCIPETPKPFCYDSDDLKYRVLGKLQTQKATYYDYCQNSKILYEYFCDGTTPKKVAVNCTNSCYKGVCTTKILPEKEKTCFAFWCW
jgi:hypothetical protein